MILRLQSSWMVRKKEDDVIDLFSSFKQQNYEIKSDNPSFYLFLKSLEKGINYPDDLMSVAKEFNFKTETVDALIAKLRSYDLLIEDHKNENPPLETLYDRQVRYFRTFEDNTCSGEQLNDNLQNKTVLIVGLGGYGSWIALLCARIGIRNIIGIDFDLVEITNLHRQILYDRSDIGLPKVKACEKKIKEVDTEINFIGHHLKINTPSDLYPFLDNVDLIFNPFSYLPLKKALNHPSGLIAQAAMDKNKPCLTFGGSWVGPLSIPGKTLCYFCAIKKLELNTNLDPDHRNQNIQKRAFAPPIVMCCSLAVHEASRFLSGCDTSQVLNGAIQLDMFSFSKSQYLPIESSPDCDFCSSNIIENSMVVR